MEPENNINLQHDQDIEVREKRKTVGSLSKGKTVKISKAALKHAERKGGRLLGAVLSRKRTKEPVHGGTLLCSLTQLHPRLSQMRFI